MKYLIAFLILFFSIHTSNAQTLETPGNKDMIDNILTVKPKTLKYTLPEAKFLFTTNRGKVYGLPLDNMPCLVPNIQSNMPVLKEDLKPYRKIPNPIPEIKIIPLTKNPGIFLEKK